MAVGEKAIWGEVHWLAKEQNGFLLWSITNALQNTSPEVYWKSQVPLTPLLWKWQTLSWPTWLGTESHFQKVKGEVFIAAAQWNGAPGEWRSKRWLIYNAATRVDADTFHDTWRGVTVGEIHCDVLFTDYKILLCTWDLLHKPEKLQQGKAPLKICSGVGSPEFIYYTKIITSLQKCHPSWHPEYHWRHFRFYYFYFLISEKSPVTYKPLSGLGDIWQAAEPAKALNVA